MSTPLRAIRLFFFLMIRRPPRSTLDRSSAASDVYKRQLRDGASDAELAALIRGEMWVKGPSHGIGGPGFHPVSYTPFRAHETVLDIVSPLLLYNKTTQHYDSAAEMLLLLLSTL